MPVDMRNMSSTLRKIWDATFANDCCPPYLSTPETDRRNKLYFDLDTLENAEEQAEWIRIFRKNIWYEEAQYYSENAHRVTDPDDLDYLNSIPEQDYFSCDLNAVKERVSNFDADRYDNYVSFNPNGRVALPSRHNSHESGRFSVQFLKAVVAVQQLGPNPRFDFLNIEGDLYVRVQNGKGFLYYDFSDNPKEV